VGYGVLEVLANQFVDTTVKSGREQKTLTFARSFVEDTCDVFKEAKFCHVIGFV
jgi:hypothetical protein